MGRTSYFCGLTRVGWVDAGWAGLRNSCKTRLGLGVAKPSGEAAAAVRVVRPARLFERKSERRTAIRGVVPYVARNFDLGREGFNTQEALRPSAP